MYHDISVHKQLSLFLVLCLSMTVALSQSDESLAEEETREFVNPHPYIVNVRAFGRSVCSGVLIGPYTVLTAAQCVDPRNGRELRPELWLNTTLSEGPEDTAVVLQVDETLFHPQYTGNANDGYNLALLRLNETSVPLRPIRIPLEAPYGTESIVGRVFSILGFGRTSLSSARTTTLQIVVVEVLDPQICIDDEIGYLEEQMFCVDSHYPCSGDQGGPVFVDSVDSRNDVLVGLASGTPCFENIERAGVTTLSTDASLSWLRQTREELERKATNQDSVTMDALGLPPAPEPLEEMLELDDDYEDILSALY